MNKKIVIIIPNENETNARFYASKGTVEYQKKKSKNIFIKTKLAYPVIISMI